MPILFSNEDVDVIANDMIRPQFSIKFRIRAEELINSIIKTRIIKGISITDNYHRLNLNVSTIQTFSQFQKEQFNLNGTKKIKTHLVCKMMLDLSSQLKYLLETYKKTFLGYSPNNLIVIDGNKFIYLSNEHLTDIVENNMVLVSYPFMSNDFFLSPEFFMIKELPHYLNYKTSYFSLACLVIYVLLSEDDFYNEYIRIKSTENILCYLNSHPIKDTRVFCVLSRCLTELPEDRNIIYI
jgi:hypothetical protein